MEDEISEEIKSEEENIINNQEKHLWFSDISVLPSKGKDEFKKEFETFVAEISVDNSINIIGIEGFERTVVYSMKCNDESISDHLFQCIKKSTSGLRNVISLEKLFEKIKVPVLQPNPNEKTINIINKVKIEFKKENNNETEGFLKTTKSILDLEAKIDALVFKLYGLNKKDINTVMQYLSNIPSYQSLVESHFDELK